MQSYNSDVSHQRNVATAPMNVMMYRNSQNMQGHMSFPNSVGQAKARMNHGNAPNQQQGGNGGNYQGNHIVCL